MHFFLYLWFVLCIVSVHCSLFFFGFSFAIIVVVVVIIFFLVRIFGTNILVIMSLLGNVYFSGITFEAISFHFIVANFVFQVCCVFVLFRCFLCIIMIFIVGNNAIVIVLIIIVQSALFDVAYFYVVDCYYTKYIFKLDAFHLVFFFSHFFHYLNYQLQHRYKGYLWY